MMAWESNPVIIRANRIKSVAIEFLEAKKPFVVENRPISASNNIGKLISGERKTFSMFPCQVNRGGILLEMLWRKDST